MVKKPRLFIALCTLPALILTIVFMIVPMVNAIYLSFTSSTALSVGFNSKFVFLDNYKYMFQDKDFLQALFNTLKLIVESALECMKAVKNPYILDMCTGSGCILISILKERADAHGTGVDLSDEALKVAVRNARTLEVAEHAEFVQSNLFSEMQNIVYGTEYMKRTAVKDTVKMTDCENSNRNYSRAYDMIISNPPYIPTAEIEDLMDEVKLHDPRMALDGMEDGLYFYRAITKQAQDHLVPGGWLLYEIGCSQGEDVAALLRKYKFEDIEIRQDLAGLDRVVLGRKKLQEDKYV